MEALRRVDTGDFKALLEFAGEWRRAISQMQRGDPPQRCAFWQGHRWESE